MLDLLETSVVESLPTLDLSGLDVSVLPDATAREHSHGTEARGCHGCAAYRPAPQLSGNLQVDPEIHLPSPGMDVDVAYYYNATSTANGVSAGAIIPKIAE